MSARHGTFIWTELMTSDREAAERFYRSVVGWTTVRVEAFDYTVFEAARPDGPGATGVAGMMAIPADLEALDVPPNWTSYVGVADCDRTLAQVVAAGGSIRRPAEDIPGIGRFAVIADPHGAVLCIMTPVPMDAAPPEVPSTSPGQIGWYELQADDGEAAFAFYSGLFGWTIDEDMDMGDLGVYRIFGLDGRALGGMMTRTPQVPAACWSSYITVDGLDAAVARLKAAGGTIVFGPSEVPGPAYIVNAVDPQGAAFSLVSATR